MDPSPITQPRLDGAALGLFAQAVLGLGDGRDDDRFRLHAQRIAALTQSDVLLVYAAGGDTDLRLLAQVGLPDAALAGFQQAGTGRSQGNDDPGVADVDLRPLGLRACNVFPVWTDGVLTAQLVVGSRRWDAFHDDTLSVFAAATRQVAQALACRGAPVGAEPSWRGRGDGTAEDKRRQFIAVLAHELRNPIAPIRSGLDLLSTGLLDTEGQHTTLQTMQRQVLHLVRLIDDLLDTVRLDTGRLQVKRQPVLLKDVVRSAIESIRPALVVKSLALTLDDAAAEVVVDVDPVRLSQAFVNILNANVKQTPEGGVIAVSVAAAASELTITFEDQGEGLSHDAIDNVFELFPNSAEQKSDEGWGIGLALVRGLVELNEGRVDLAARPVGPGSVYTVRLPRSDLAVPAPASAGPAPSWPSHRVLIVDDNRDAADTLGLLFELDGHTVRLAHDGPTAVTEAHEFQPEVILMDLGLPGFNGNEATQQIRAQLGTVRPFIIALTGWGAAADKEATRRAGCDLHLVKPVSHDELRQTILELTSQPASGSRHV